ncbi:hypothetical protein [Streptomyces sp. NPDC002088]|uniref:hypothetical protein n=1 Tax=Streptomyces sp. NPDC002088 TaxID=3154665 RepID=UPI003327F1E4
MAQKKAPFKAGDHIAYMPDGHSLVPALVVSVEQSGSGAWRGDILTEAHGLLANRMLHSDFVIKKSGLQEANRIAWASAWERLEKANG